MKKLSWKWNEGNVKAKTPTWFKKDKLMQKLWCSYVNNWIVFFFLWNNLRRIVTLAHSLLKSSSTARVTCAPPSPGPPVTIHILVTCFLFREAFSPATHLRDNRLSLSNYMNIYELTQWTFQKQNNILEKTSRHSLIFDVALRNVWQVNATYLRAKLKFLSAQYFLFVLFLFILSKLTCWTYLFSKLKSQCVWNRRLVFSLWGMFCSDLRSGVSFWCKAISRLA